MPQDNVIKFGANFNEIKKGFLSIKRELTSLQSKDFKIKVSKETEDFFSEKRGKVISGLNRKIQTVETHLQKLNKQFLQTGKGANQIDKTASALTKLKKELKDISSVKVSGGTIGTTSGGVGGVGGLLGKLGLGGLGGMLTGAGALAAAGMGARWSYGRSLGYAEQQLGFRALGYGPGELKRGFIQPARENLYSKKEALELGMQWARETGGAAGFGEATALGRAFNLDFGQIAGMGGLARKGGGDQKKTFIDMLAAGVSIGLETAKVPEYLQAQSQLLTGVLQAGPTNLGFFSTLLSTLTKEGGEFARFNPSATATTIQKISEGYTSQGRGGNLFGLLAPAVMKQPQFRGAAGAFDIETITSYGLAAPNLQQYKNLPERYKNYLTGLGLGGPGAGQASMQAIYETVFGAKGENRSGKVMRGAMQAYLPGAKGGELDQAINFLGTWHKYKGQPLGEKAREKLQKQFEEKRKTVVESMDGTLKSIDVNIKAIKDKFTIPEIIKDITGLSAYEKLEEYRESKEPVEGKGVGLTGRTSWLNKKGLRTDRHFNPTAFTTQIAKQAGLIEGIDYTVGDPFDEGKYNTAKLLKDPIEQTIKVIDKLGFFTKSGEQRWSHTAIPKSEWETYDKPEKISTILEMYKREGGSGKLAINQKSKNISEQSDPLDIVSVQNAFMNKVFGDMIDGIKQMVSKQEETKQEISKGKVISTSIDNISGFNE